MASKSESKLSLDFTEYIDEIDSFIDNYHYEEAVEKSFKIVEKCLENLFKMVFTILNTDKQFKILKRLKDDFKGKKFNDLKIGEKLRIFKDYKLLSHLEIHLDKSVNPKEFLKLNDIRVDSAHGKRQITKADAVHVYAILLKFLEKIGISSSPSKSKKNKIDKKKILTNLPDGDFVEFIGREEKINDIKKLLLHKKVHVLSIDGIGGVGKSALALEIAHQLEKEKEFDAIIWVTAKKDRLTYKGIVEIENSLIDLEDLFDEILKTFNETDFVKHGNFETKENMVLDLLKENHSLIIVDNLETIDDDAIIQFLIDVNFPIESKVLITSRKRIGQVEYIVYLKKFNLEETRKYIKSQLKFRDYNGTCSEGIIREIHEKTGGIPLAIKMIIPWILEGKIRDKLIKEIDENTDILKFCFNRVYNKFLPKEQKKLFCIVSLAPAEIDRSALKFISSLNEEKFNESITCLINYSLIYTLSDESSNDEEFSMLPLTQEFGKKMANKDYPNLKENINKKYLEYLKILRNKEYSTKKSMAIHTAKEAKKLAATGDIEGAKSLFKVAIGYDKKCDYAYYLSAQFLTKIGEYKQSKNVIKKALKYNDKNSHYWMEYASIEEKSGNFKNSEKILETAIKKIKKDPYLTHKLILIKSKISNYSGAIKLAKENLIKNAQTSKEKHTNTLFAIAISECQWRKACKMIEMKKYDLASAELIGSVLEIEQLIENNLIFKDNEKLKWQMKKTYKKLGDLALQKKDKGFANEYYEKAALYTV